MPVKLEISTAVPASKRRLGLVWTITVLLVAIGLAVACRGKG
jgi:hypothetical protein